MIRPQTNLRIPIKVNGLGAGEEARVVVAAVDVGILNLTNYKPPAPEDFYLGQRRLTVEVRDLYGQLIDGMQATRGQLRTGGDAAGGELSGSPPAQAPLALYSGIVTVGRDGTAVVEFPIPAFAGTARVMAVAWGKDKLGHAVGDVIVRDPVVVTASLPRFLLTGDRSNLQLDLDNAEGPAGDYSVTVRTEGASATADATRTLSLKEKQRSAVVVPLDAAKVGASTIHVRATGPANFVLDRSYALATNPATQTLTRRTVRNIAKGESSDAVERSVRRSGAGDRTGCAVGWRLDRARRGSLARRAGTLSLRLLGAAHQPRLAIALCQRAARAGLAHGCQCRGNHPRCHRARIGAPGFDGFVRLVVRGRRRRRGLTPMPRIF